MEEYTGSRDTDTFFKSILESLPRDDLDSGSYLAALSLVTTMQMLDFLDRFLNGTGLSFLKNEAGRENQTASGTTSQSMQSLLSLLQQAGAGQGKINPSTLLSLLSLLDKDKTDSSSSKEILPASKPTGTEKPR